MDSRFVVVIDQLEEIFTLCESEAERSEFIDEIGTLAADAGPGSALVVLGMRADFYARATAYRLLRQSMQSRQVVVGAMSAAEVRQAIVRPARAVGLTLEAGLTERLLRDLGVDEGASADGSAGESPDADGAQDGSRSAGGGYEPGRLPLLAHALRATWQYRDGNRLTVAGYAATGGIAGAIARTAEDVYARLDEPGQAATRQVFLGLVRVGEATGDGDATADTRRRVAADSLLGRAADPAAARAALDAFTAARLLTSGGQAVEITHEALLRRWPRLREWIDEDRSGLLVRQELEDAAATWAREGRDAAGLYGGVRLASAQGWATDPGHLRELTQAGREFLTASERRRRRGVRRRNGIIAALAALSLLLGRPVDLRPEPAVRRPGELHEGHGGAARGGGGASLVGLPARHGAQVRGAGRPHGPVVLPGAQHATDLPGGPHHRARWSPTRTRTSWGRPSTRRAPLSPGPPRTAGFSCGARPPTGCSGISSSRRSTEDTRRSTASRSARRAGSWRSPSLAVPGCSTCPTQRAPCTWVPFACRA